MGKGVDVVGVRSPELPASTAENRVVSTKIREIMLEFELVLIAAQRKVQKHRELRRVCQEAHNGGA